MVQPAGEGHGSAQSAPGHQQGFPEAERVAEGREPLEGRDFAMPPSTLIVAPASVDSRQAAISITAANDIAAVNSLWLKPSSMPSAGGEKMKWMVRPAAG
jgi:hypothetical protein